MDERIDLLDLNPEELKGLLAGWGDAGYRAVQIERWIYQSLIEEFDGMTDLPHSLRDRLKVSARIGSLAPLTDQKSADGLTRKVLFELEDGQSLETVLMLYADAPDSPEMAEGEQGRNHGQRRTVCVSTQVGCPIGCPFCATGQAGFVRNLTTGEIVAQVLNFARERKRAGYARMPLTNVVIMGMGEPLMKFDVTWQAVEALTDPARYGLGARRITVSTSGLIPGIEQLAYRRSQINLAVSLHAADDELRDVLVPINRRYPLRDLIRACREYVDRTRRRVTFEYALMQGLNDRLDQARAVARLLKGLLCHVNLIPLNPTSDSSYQRTPYDQVKKFERVLRDTGIPTTLRVEKGIEITAGCGQLRQRMVRPRPIRIAALPTAA
jgi:23S rRNA (adenine2503-C2)-methyltransferase